MAPRQTPKRLARLSLCLTALAIMAAPAALPAASADKVHICDTFGDLVAYMAGELANGTPADQLIAFLIQYGCPLSWIEDAACLVDPGLFVWCGDALPAPIGGVAYPDFVGELLRCPTCPVKHGDVVVDAGVEPADLAGFPGEQDLRVSFGITDLPRLDIIDLPRLVDDVPFPPQEEACEPGTFFAGWVFLAPAGPTVALCVGV